MACGFNFKVFGPFFWSNEVCLLSRLGTSSQMCLLVLRALVVGYISYYYYYYYYCKITLYIHDGAILDLACKDFRQFNLAHSVASMETFSWRCSDLLLLKGTTHTVIVEIISCYTYQLNKNDIPFDSKPCSRH